MISIPYYDENHNRMMAADVLQSGDVGGGISWKMCYGLSNTNDSFPYILTDETIGLIVRYSGNTSASYWINQSSVSLCAFCVLWATNMMGGDRIETNAVEVGFGDSPTQLTHGSNNSWILVFILPWYEVS